MINYGKIQDAIDRETNLAFRAGIPNNGFLNAIDMLEEAVDNEYTYHEWLDLIREIRNNQFTQARGEMKSILDNLLTRVLDAVEFG